MKTYQYIILRSIMSSRWRRYLPSTSGTVPVVFAVGSIANHFKFWCYAHSAWIAKAIFVPQAFIEGWEIMFQISGSSTRRHLATGEWSEHWRKSYICHQLALLTVAIERIARHFVCVICKNHAFASAICGSNVKVCEMWVNGFHWNDELQVVMKKEVLNGSTTQYRNYGVLNYASITISSTTSTITNRTPVKSKWIRRCYQTSGTTVPKV